MNATCMYAKNITELQEVIHAHRTLGKKIVLVSGAFDLLHVGHCEYLKKSKESLRIDTASVILVVGVDSDEKVRRKKGKDRPIVSEQERAEILSHIRYVDVLYIKQADEEKWGLIQAIRPDMLILSKRTQYSQTEKIALLEFCEAITELESQATTSTTARIRTLLIGIGEEFKEEFKGVEGKIVRIMNDFKQELETKIRGGEKDEE